MIKVITGRYDNLEYDVRGIAMSFYPGEDIVFVREIDVPQGNDMPQENVASQEADHVIHLEKIFEDAGVGISKNDLRRKLYRHLEKETGRSLPWGILIGIRPTKLTRQFIEEKMCQMGRSCLTHFGGPHQLNADGPTQDDRKFPSELIVEAAKWMQDEYLVSSEKSVLASVIAARELQVLGERKEKVRAEAAQEPLRAEVTQETLCSEATHSTAGFSLYVGIPFCPSRCSYCSFASQPASLWEGRMGEYVDALIKELEAVHEMTANVPASGNSTSSRSQAAAACNSTAVAQSNLSGAVCNSIYIGGGTPTTLPDVDFERLLKKVRELFAPAPVAIEFTVEAGRPDTITKEKLAIMKRSGVNRISINPQSMNEKTLVAIGRNHKVSDIAHAFNLAREMGFNNINMDIILGLPGESADDVKTTLKEIKKLKPDSLTVHALAVKRAARLNLESDHAVMPGRGEEDSKQMMEASSLAAADLGLSPYYMYRQKNMAGNLENVGYAAPGKECYYNIAMMEETESIIACGAGTVSKRVTNLQPSESESDAKIKQPITRCDTHKDPKLYIEQIDEMIARKQELFK